MEFVYSINLGNVFWIDGAYVKMSPGDVWFADDPFVVARPDLFSATPVAVHSTIGRPTPDRTPLTADRPAAVDDEEAVEFGAPRRGRGRRA